MISSTFSHLASCMCLIKKNTNKNKTTDLKQRGVWLKEIKGWILVCYIASILVKWAEMGIQGYAVPLESCYPWISTNIKHKYGKTCFNQISHLCVKEGEKMYKGRNLIGANRQSNLLDYPEMSSFCAFMQSAAKTWSPERQTGRVGTETVRPCAEVSRGPLVEVFHHWC